MWLALLGLAGLIAVTRLHSYDEPLERDITMYAVIGHEMLAGRPLYADLWDHKPPAIYATYALGELLAGYGRRAIYLLNVAAAIATLFGVYAAGSVSGGVTAGLWAGAFWAVVSGGLWLEGNQPNSELFMNACLTWAFALLLRRDRPGFDARWAVGVGLLFALASLYKPVVVATASLLAAAYVGLPPGGPPQRRAALGEVVLMALVGVAGWVGVTGYFAATGAGAAFRDAVFVFNRYYAGDVAANLGAGFRPAHLVLLQTAPDVWPPAALTALGAVCGFVAGPRRPWILLLVLAVGTQLSVALPGRFFPHYYQLWLPPLAIGAGWATSALGRLEMPPRGWLGCVAGGTALVLMIALDLPLYRLSAESWSRMKYGELFVDADRLGRDIDRLLAPGETFYEWGNESGLYFASRRRPPTGVLNVWPTVEGPVATRLSQRVVTDLDRVRPELFVVEGSALHEFGPHHAVLEWFSTRYRRLPAEFDRGQFFLFARRGGQLEARVERALTRGRPPS